MSALVAALALGSAAPGLPLAALPWLDPQALLASFGPWAVLGVCALVFAETGLLVGFLFPGDTLLVITGVLAATDPGALGLPVGVIALLVAVAAFAGGELGHLVGHRVGPRVFERKESGLFSRAHVQRTHAFFERFGPVAVILARFVPVVRTFAPLAAGAAHMSYRRYSLYNAVGAVVWGVGVTLLGWGIGHVPPVAGFVSRYVDLILVGAVVATVLPIAAHYLVSARRARKADGPGTDPSERAGAAPRRPAAGPPPRAARRRARGPGTRGTGGCGRSSRRG